MNLIGIALQSIAFLSQGVVYEGLICGEIQILVLHTPIQTIVRCRKLILVPSYFLHGDVVISHTLLPFPYIVQKIMVLDFCHGKEIHISSTHCLSGIHHKGDIAIHGFQHLLDIHGTFQSPEPILHRFVSLEGAEKPVSIASQSGPHEKAVGWSIQIFARDGVHVLVRFINQLLNGWIVTENR